MLVLQLLSLVLLSAIPCYSDSVVKQNGDDIKLACETVNKDLTTISWTFNGESTKKDMKYGAANGKLTGTLERRNLNTTDTGLYQCFRDGSELLQNFTVTVVSITGEGVTIIKNTTSATLTCEVEDSDLTINNISWRRGNESLTNDAKYSMKIGSLNASLQISNPSAADAGAYSCLVTVEVDGNSTQFQQQVALNIAPHVGEFAKLRSKVEDEKAVIECNVTGYPTPNISWYRKLEDTEEFKIITFDDRVKALNSSQGIPNARLVIMDLKIKEDRGEYECKAVNNFGDDSGRVTLKVKDKLAAVWPFLGIVAEVAVLCLIIWIFEKRRGRKMEEEEEVDQVKQDLMTHTNGEDKELRQRNTSSKS